MSNPVLNGYILDPTSRKFNCPDCGQERFVRYVREEDEDDLLPEHVGICDRKDNCCYRYSHYDYFMDKGIAMDEYSKGYHRKNPDDEMEYQERIEYSTLDEQYIMMLLKLGDTYPNAFFEYLMVCLGIDKIKLREMRYKYFVGSTDKSNIDADGVYWFQRSYSGEFRTGKKIYYNSNGHRNKLIMPRFVHSFFYERDEYELKQCVFGEHLLREYPDKPICLVEAEKTAFVLSYFFPRYNWLACGGAQNFSNTIISTWGNVPTYIFPDASPIGEKNQQLLWTRKATKIKAFQGIPTYMFDINRFTTVQEKVDGVDILDLFIKQPHVAKAAMKDFFRNSQTIQYL